jgi:hypothetical protein
MRKKSLIIILAALVGLIVISGWWLSASEILHNESNSENPINQLDDALSMYNTNSGALTFVNNEYHYSVTFPHGWTVGDTNRADLVPFYDENAQSQQTDSELTQGMKIEISAQVNTDSLPLAEQADQAIANLGADNIISRNDVMINNLPAIELTANVQGYSIVTYVATDRYLYWVAGYIGDETETAEYSSIYHSIVSPMVIE